MIVYIISYNLFTYLFNLLTMHHCDQDALSHVVVSSSISHDCRTYFYSHEKWKLLISTQMSHIQAYQFIAHLQCECISRQTAFVWYCWWGSGIGTGLRTSPGLCWPQGHGLPPASCIADPDPDSGSGLDLKFPSGSGCCSPSALAVCGQELLDILLKDTSRLNVD